MRLSGDGLRFRFIDEHDRDVIDDRIHPSACCTAQAILVVSEFYRLFAGGTDEDIKKFLCDGHEKILSAELLLYPILATIGRGPRAIFRSDRESILSGEI